ncbi:MAG: hypothetical protein HYT93_04305 [Parcubacteria group bacterium]|nr:hypothetical protein [Parcubacteria group bacterium]
MIMVVVKKQQVFEGYPDEPLGRQVRAFKETQSAMSVVLDTFFKPRKAHKDLQKPS